MQKVSSSLIKSVSASQILKGDARDGQVLSYSETVDAWVPTDPTKDEGTRSSPDTQLTVQDSSIGQIWITAQPETINNSSWKSIAISSNGKYQTAVGFLSGIYISADYGSTWYTASSSLSVNWTSVDVSGDGRYQVACTNQYIYTSNDFGVTWIPRTEIAGGEARNWTSVRLTHEGRVQVASVYSTINGFLYKSEDYGDTWAVTLGSINGFGQTWSSIGISFDGKYQTAIAGVGGSRPYRTNDYGEIWNIVDDPNLPINAGDAYVDMSDNGKYQTMVRDNNFAVYVSNNYGVSWTAVPIPDNQFWGSVTIPSDGRIQVITSRSVAKMYVSLNWGTTWQLLPSPVAVDGSRRWVDIAMSFDGKILIGLERNTGPYMSFADSNFNGNLLVTDTIRASAIYGTFYGDASNLLIPGIGFAGTTAEQFTGDGSTRVFSISSSFNGLDSGRYIVSVGGLDQPPQYWTISSTNGGRLTFVEAPKNGEVISIRTLVGNSYPTVYSSTSNSIGYGLKTFAAKSSWSAYEAGVLVTAYAGTNQWMSGYVNSVAGLSATIFITSMKGSGTYSSWSIRYGFALNMSSTQPIAGDSLVFNGSMWTPGAPTVTQTTNATQLQSRPVSNNVPDTGYVLGWNGSQWVPQESDAIKLQGRYINYFVSPQVNQVLAWDGNMWTPIDANANANAIKIQSRDVVDTLPNNGQALIWNQNNLRWEPTDINANAVSLQSKPISVTPPSNGQALIWNNQENAWEPGTPIASADAISIQTRSVSNVLPSNGQSLVWNGDNNMWEPKYADAASLKGNNLSDTAPSINGQSLVWNGTLWEPNLANASSLRGSPISSTLPTTVGQSLVWNGTVWEPGTITASNDASFLRGSPISTIAPNVSGQSLVWNGTDWEPNLSNASFLRGSPISTTPPQHNNVLKYDSVSGWQPFDGIVIQNWSPSISYNTGDIVHYNGRLYAANGAGLTYAPDNLSYSQWNSLLGFTGSSVPSDPVTVAGWMDIIVNGSVRKMPYYA